MLCLRRTTQGQREESGGCGQGIHVDADRGKVGIVGEGEGLEEGLGGCHVMHG